MAKNTNLQLVEDLDLENWEKWFKQRVQLHLHRPVATPKTVLQRSFKKLLEEISYPTLIAECIDRGLQNSFSYIYSMGPSEKMLTVGVIHNTAQEEGGYELHWNGIYYSRYVRTQEEFEYFNHFLSLYDDSITAPLGSEAIVNTDHYRSWDDVKKLAEFKLDLGIKEIKRRMKYEGVQIEFIPIMTTSTDINIDTRILLDAIRGTSTNIIEKL